MAETLNALASRILRQTKRTFRFVSVVDDPYVAGVVAGHMGLGRMMMESRWCLPHGDEDGGDDEVRELFALGMAEHTHYQLSDIGWELRKMWKHNPQGFATMARSTVGVTRAKEMIRVAQHAHAPRYKTVLQIGGFSR